LRGAAATFTEHLSGSRHANEINHLVNFGHPDILPRGKPCSDSHRTTRGFSKCVRDGTLKKSNAAHLTSTQATAKARWGIGLGELRRRCVVWRGSTTSTFEHQNAAIQKWPLRSSDTRHL